MSCQVEKQKEKKTFWGSTKYTERTVTVLTRSALSLKGGLWRFQTARTTELGFWCFKKGELTWPGKVLKDDHEIIVTSLDVSKCLNKYVDIAFIHHNGYTVKDGKRLADRRVWSRYKTYGYIFKNVHRKVRSRVQWVTVAVLRFYPLFQSYGNYFQTPVFTCLPGL